MNVNIYTVYDDKAEAYLPPFFLPTDGMAVRTFADCANDKEHNFCIHPSDYTLFRVGSFNNINGEIKDLHTHKNLGLAIEHKTQVEMFEDPPAELTLAKGKNQ